MIANIKTGTNFKGAFHYNLRKIESGQALFMYVSGFMSESPSFSEMLKTFEMITNFCPSVSKPVFHTSINFSPDEYLEDDKLKAVVDEYMEKLGFGRVPYVVFKHCDTNHQHVHVISINIEERHGRYMKINDSYQHRRSEAISRRIEKEYGLVVAPEAKNNRQQKSAAMIPELKQYGKVNTYGQLAEVANYVFENTRFNSQEELNAILNQYNITCFKNNTRDGNVYYKFSFHDPATRKFIGVSGTPSQLKLNYSSQELDQVLTRNKEEKSNLDVSFKEVGKKLLDRYLFINVADLERALKEDNIFLLDEWRCFDGNSKTIISLSELGLVKRFIQAETIKKEYFKNLIKSATEFRKSKQIFHESTMLKDPNVLKEFRSYLDSQNTHLNQAQLDLLYNSFCSYKLKNIAKIEQKEHEKNIEFVNKLIDYTNKLHLSAALREYFFSLFNILVDHTNIVKVGNSVDSMIHEVHKEFLNPLNAPEKSSRGEVLPVLNSYELALVKNCIYDKPAFISDGIDINRVRPFLTAEFVERYHLDQAENIERTASENLYNMPSSFVPGVLNSKNEYEPHFLKKKKKKGDDDDDEPRRKKRKR